MRKHLSILVIVALLTALFVVSCGGGGGGGGSQPDHNANLSGLTLSQGTLSPAFGPDTTSYAVEVASGVASISVTPAAAGAHASIIVNSAAVASGSTSGNIALNTGANTITVIVTAEDGTTTKTYTVTVTKLAEPSHSADLAGLTLSQGTLSPSFSANVLSYTAEVQYAVAAITVTPTVAGVNATVKVNGTAVTSGAASGNIALNTGSNTITVVVTAEDDTTMKTYTITVTKLAEPSHNADLSGLTLSQGTLSPVFSSATTSYTATVPNTTVSITVTPTAAGVNASIKINSVSVVSGTPSGNIAVSEGTVITIAVAAEDGTTIKTYIVTVTHGSGAYQMGGAIQGNQLALANIVSTVAGVSRLGSQDDTGTAARFSGPKGVTTDGTNLYVADQTNNTIRKIVISTGVVTTIAGTAGLSGSTDGTGAAARFYRPTGITTDGPNLYVADTYNNRIRKIVISSGVVTTFAGSSSQGSTDGTGTAAKFNNPEGITTDGTNLYVADTGNDTIRQIVISNGVVTTLAGTAGNIGTTDGTGAAARFWDPIGITTHGTNLYVTDSRNCTIRQIVISSGAVSTFAGNGGACNSTDATGTAARFNSPAGITTDGTNLYVADWGVNNTIRQIVISSADVTTLAGTAGSTGFADGTGSAAKFYNPYGVITAGTNLYVTDTSNNNIRQIVISSAAVTTFAGTASPGGGAADGTGAAATFSNPVGITTDGENLYVADTYNHTIRKIVISSGAVTTLAGTAGSLGSADGTGAAARFYRPKGITTDGTNLYVADTNNYTIRQIVISSGTVTTLAGTAGLSGSADGTGAAARFRSPSDITTDGTYLYVADMYNHTVRKILISSGVVTTVAGTAGSIGSADGTGAAAGFNYPQGITTDGTNLYVCDTYNFTVRKIVISSGLVSTLAGAAGSIGSADGTGRRWRGTDAVETE